MKPAHNQFNVWEHLLALASALQVEIRLARFSRGGGLETPDVAIQSGSYRLKNQNFIVINGSLPKPEKTRLLARELARLDLSQIYVAPRVRVFLAESAKI